MFRAQKRAQSNTPEPLGQHDVPSPSDLAGWSVLADATSKTKESADRSQQSAPPHLSGLKSGPVDARPVVKATRDLRPHPALADLGINFLDELNDSALLGAQIMPSTILIDTDGVILAGFGRWRFALLQNEQNLDCIQYAICGDESLKFILRRHNARRGWNAFTRIRVALLLERHFQEQALENMRTGGRYKGLANLPEASHIDVRKEIAVIAGVGERNVTKVKTVLQTAHTRIINALASSEISIDAAMQFCSQTKADQIERFISRCEDQEIRKVIRMAVSKPRKQHVDNRSAIAAALQSELLARPEAIEIRITRLKRTIVLIGEDMLAGPLSQKELALPHAS